MINKILSVGLVTVLIISILFSGCISNRVQMVQPVSQSSQCTMTNQTDGALLQCTGDNVHVRLGNKDFDYMYPILIWYYLIHMNQVSVYNTYTGSSIPISIVEGNNLNSPIIDYSNPETNYGWDASNLLYEPVISNSPETSSGWDINGYDTDTSSGWDYSGYDSGGYDIGGWDSGGYSGGYDSGGWDSGGYDSGGYDSGGFDSGGWD